jgi:hypothetical protein
MCAHDSLLPFAKRFRAKWVPVRVKKTRQNKKLEPGSDPIRTEQAPDVTIAEPPGQRKRQGKEYAM